MTGFLASVRDAQEAEIALRAAADIIDLKEPSQGALGAVGREKTRAVVSAIARRTAVSATIGDLSMVAELIRDAVLDRAALGVDYVKFGLFPDGDPQACLDGLSFVAGSVRLVVVIFADRPPAFDAVEAAARMGAFGVMLDTADKRGGSLRDHLALDRLADFVTRAKAHGLAVGLAGSLTRGDVPELLPLAPDLLGFRGALCQASRNSALDPQACAAIRSLIPEAALTAALGTEAELPEAAAEALC